ncbi:glycerophosphodiester phosphodiesterase [Planococcus salinarum]|uniref:glycerophosphodiester phosphodiesterase n=1 Tax=Planococcus salinarum TaxID=622695 RepID=UPI000E3E7E8B|nr:glycerophosphodiester phosphodiesterase [Planococcus salinarum]TAA72836.1 glycerophosphodiester phosphodiesterase [Planococcus salinarum]
MKKMLIILVAVMILAGVYIFKDANQNDRHSSLLDEDSFVLIAHRGASAIAPEHTLASYQMAMDMDADFIEIDLQMTKDGVLVAFHDDTVDRTTDGSGKVAEMALADLKKLDAGSWFNAENPDRVKDEYIGIGVPTLEEIFTAFGDRTNYYIETKQPDKNDGMEENLMELLDQYGLLEESLPEGKVIIQSFSADSLKAIHKLDDEIPLIQLTDDLEQEIPSPETFELYREYAVGIGVGYRNADEAYIAAAKEAGLLVHLFVVDELAEGEKLKSWGANGIFTNDIEAVGSLK